MKSMSPLVKPQNNLWQEVAQPLRRAFCPTPSLVVARENKGLGGSHSEGGAKDHKEQWMREFLPQDRHPL